MRERSGRHQIPDDNLRATESRRARLGVMRRIPLCRRFAGIPILEMRSDGLTIPKLVDQIGKFHLAVRIGILWERRSGPWLRS